MCNNLKNLNNDYNKETINKDNQNDVIKEWRNVKGDLDDFLFFYEENKMLSDR